MGWLLRVPSANMLRSKMACYNSSNSVNFIKQKKSKLNKYMPYQFSSVQFLSRVRLCDPMNRSTPGLPVHHQLLEFTQISILNSFFSPKSNKCWKVCQALMCMPGPAQGLGCSLSQASKFPRMAAAPTAPWHLLNLSRSFSLKKHFFPHDIEMRYNYILKSPTTACWLRKIYFTKCVASAWQPYSQLRVSLLMGGWPLMAWCIRPAPWFFLLPMLLQLGSGRALVTYIKNTFDTPM